MKIAIIVNPLIPVPPKQYGGIERIVFMLIQELIKSGHDVTLYANENSVPGCKLVGYREHDPYSPQDFVKINALTFKIALKGFDLVHTFGRMTNIALLMRSRLPKIVSYQLPPTISQVKKALKLARKNSIHFTACSGYIAKQIGQAGTEATVIYNGVDINEYQFNSSVPVDAPLVFLGRIQKEKGTDIAIEVAKATGLNLIVAGNIPGEEIHQKYFEEEVKPHIDGKQIKYIGPVDNVQKNELLGNCRAFLMPVTWDEPFGIVMAEALACGAPVIGFRRGAVPEVVISGKNGFICENREEMIAAVLKTGAIDRWQCRQIAEERFSANVLAGQYEELYRRATGKV